MIFQSSIVSCYEPCQTLHLTNILRLEDRARRLSKENDSLSQKKSYYMELSRTYAHFRRKSINPLMATSTNLDAINLIIYSVPENTVQVIMSLLDGIGRIYVMKIYNFPVSIPKIKGTAVTNAKYTAL